MLYSLIFLLQFFFIDSPKFRNKGPTPTTRNARSFHESSRKPMLPNKRPMSTHNIVVVRAATKEAGLERDPEIQRIQVRYFFIFGLSKPACHSVCICHQTFLNIFIGINIELK